MPRIDQQLIDSTFFLYESADAAEAGGSAGGTGFVVSLTREIWPGDGTRQHFTHYYAVTNAHVARGWPVVRLSRGTGHEVIAFDQVDWEYHCQGDDVAVVPLDHADDSNSLSAISTRYFLDRRTDRHSIGVGDDVFMIGLFVDHEGHETNNPMARFGNISMMASDRAPVRFSSAARVCHIVDMHSRSGFSGSPAFVYRTFGADLARMSYGGEEVVAEFEVPTVTPQQIRQAIEQSRFSHHSRPKTETLSLKIRTMPVLKLLGIHFAQFPEKWPIIDSDSPLPSRKHVDGVSGMTCVVPAEKIRELLNIPKLVARREATEQAKGARADGRPRLEGGSSHV